MTPHSYHNDGPRLAWVRGNDVLLRLTVTEVGTNPDTGGATWQPLNIEACDHVNVTMLNARFGRQFPMAASVSAETPGTLLIDIPGNTPCGDYVLELTASHNGRRQRSCEGPLFSIVERSAQAQFTTRLIEGARTADLQMAVQAVTQAAARGQNAYELWLAAGHQGTLQDYLNGFWRPRTVDYDEEGLMSVADKRTLDGLAQIKEMAAETATAIFRDVFGGRQGR